MKTEERDSLGALYATWDTNALVDASRRRRSEYAPEALALMDEELRHRDVPLKEAAPPQTSAAPQVSLPPDASNPSRKEAAPQVQYVGAWGLWFLFNLCAMLFLGWALGGRRPRGPVEAIVPSVILLLVSFLTFRFAVKWLVVDDIIKKLKHSEKDKDTQP